MQSIAENVDTLKLQVNIRRRTTIKSITDVLPEVFKNRSCNKTISYVRYLQHNYSFHDTKGEKW